MTNWKRHTLKMSDMDLADLDSCVRALRAISDATPQVVAMMPTGYRDITKTVGVTHGLLERIWCQLLSDDFEDLDKTENDPIPCRERTGIGHQ